jgi:hypothetical protein
VPTLRKTAKSPNKLADATAAAAGVAALPSVESIGTATPRSPPRSGTAFGNHRQCASGDQDRDRVDTGEAGDHGAERDRAQHQGLHRGAPEPQESLHDDGNDHWFDSVEKGNDLWQRSEMYVSPCAAEDDQRGRKDEACSTKEKAGPSCAPVTNEDCQLGRAWTGDEVHRAEKVEEFLSGEPRPSTDHLLLHHRDVSRWTTKSSQTQAQKEEHHARPRAFGGGASSVMRVSALVSV